MGPDWVAPRRVAVRVLTRVLSQGEFLDLVLSDEARTLEKQAIAWLYEVCSGVLRWKRRLEFFLDSVCYKKKPSGWLRKVLLLAVYQILVQERSSVAGIVFETVSAVKSQLGEAPSRFANACLRQIVSHQEAFRSKGFLEFSEGAIAASLPEWIWSRLERERGLEWATQYAEACLQRPVTWGFWGPPSFEAFQVEGKVNFLEKKWIIQDISHQNCVREVLSEVPSVRRVLDVCAAPGGKALHLAWRGCDVLATDYSEDRLKILKENQLRTQIALRMLNWTDYQAQKQVLGASQDLIWMDAPCSGTGILRRHPDVRWLRQEKEFSELLKIQAGLLEEHWGYLSVGSYLVYSVCSVLKEEGPDLINRLNLKNFQVREWFYCPQESPYGDGLWTVLLKK